MIDIHCHIIPNLDDGPKTMEESINMAKIANEDGISTIVSTTHFHTDIDYKYGKDLIKEIDLFKEELVKNNISLEILYGNELYYTQKLLSEIDDKKFLTLNNTKYLLMEFSTNNFPVDDIEDIIYEISIRDYIPIIAHAERYNDLLKNVNKVYDIINNGALIQVNASSVIGRNGEDMQVFINKLLSCNMVHFVASDAHSAKKRRPIISTAYNYISSKYSLELADKIFKENTNKMLNNGLIDVSKAIKYEEKGVIKKLKNIFSKKR